MSSVGEGSQFLAGGSEIGGNPFHPGLTEHLRVEIRSALGAYFLLLDDDAMCVGERVVPNASDLPGNFYVGLVCLNDEMPLLDFFPHDGLRELPDDGELVTEIAVQRLEVIRHRDGRVAIRVSCHIAI